MDETEGLTITGDGVRVGQGLAELADDVGIVSRSKDSLAKLMSVVVETCDAFGLTVSENKTEAMALLPPAAPAERLSIVAAGRRCKQTREVQLPRWHHQRRRDHGR